MYNKNHPALTPQKKQKSNPCGTKPAELQNQSVKSSRGDVARKRPLLSLLRCLWELYCRKSQERQTLAYTSGHGGADATDREETEDGQARALFIALLFSTQEHIFSMEREQYCNTPGIFCSYKVHQRYPLVISIVGGKRKTAIGAGSCRVRHNAAKCLKT